MPDRRCKHIFAMLSDFLNSELSVNNCRELERHLKGCEPCIAYLPSLKNTVEACRRYQIRLNLWFGLSTDIGKPLATNED